MLNHLKRGATILRSIRYFSSQVCYPTVSETESYIDVRSDTVTRPSKRMREAMMKCAVGDDCYDDDPTVNKL